MIENLEVAVATYPGPVPTLDEIRAARDRHGLWPEPGQPAAGRDVRAASLLAARLAQLAQAEPDTAGDIAAMLAASVQVMADRHGRCAVVGCTRCLYLADAGAITRAWEPR